MNEQEPRQFGVWHVVLVNLLSFVYLAGYAVFESDARLSRVSVLSTLLLLCVLVARLLGGRQLVIPRLLGAPLLFGTLVVAATLWADDFGTALLYGTMTLSALCGAVAIWVALYNGLSYRTLILAAITGSMVVTVSSIMNPGEMDEMVLRSGGTFSNPNAAGVYLTCCAFILASPPPGTNRVSRLNLLLAAAIVASAVVFTGSRKTVFSAAMLVIYAAIVLTRQSGVRFRFAPVLIGFTAMAAMALLIGPTLNLSSSPLAKVGTLQRFDAMLKDKDESAEIRRGMVSKGMELWLRRPWIGYGYGQFARQTAYATYSHCNYIELLCSTGVLGVLIYYYFYVMIIAQAIGMKLPQHFAALTIVAVSLLTDTASVSNLSKPSWIMAVLAAYLVTSRRSTKILTLGSSYSSILPRRLRSQNLVVRTSPERLLRRPAIHTVLRRKKNNAQR